MTGATLQPGKSYYVSWSSTFVGKIAVRFTFTAFGDSNHMKSFVDNEDEARRAHS